MQEQRNPYNGPVEVWIGDAKRFDAHAVLAEFVEYDPLPSGEPFYGRTSWRGHLTDLNQHDLYELVSAQFELRFPSGQVGQAALEDMTTGRIQGLRETPWMGPPQ